MSTGSLRLGICAGETSGDILAGAVLRAWQQTGATVEISGIGGPQTVAAGLQSLAPMERLAVMGLVEPLKRLPELLSIRRQLIAQQLDLRPQLFWEWIAQISIYPLKAVKSVSIKTAIGEPRFGRGEGTHPEHPSVSG